MLNNYIKISFRNIKRGRLYALINIFGLSIGLASALFIYAFVNQELSFDKFHNDSERIYRVGYEVGLGSSTKIIASSPYRLARHLSTDFPEIESISHFSRVFEGEVTYENKKLYEERISLVDSSFLQLFDFPLISGNKVTALTAPNSVVITQSIEEKYFGSNNGLGKTLKVQEPFGDRDMELVVTGVMPDMKPESHFHFDIMVSMSTGADGGYFPDGLQEAWGWDSQYTYIKLPVERDIEAFREDLRAFGNKHIADAPWFVEFFAQPLEDIHLYSNLNSEIEANGDIAYVYIFSAVAFIILLLACVNYMNLATAKAINRSKEVSIRKAVGAQRSQIISQFLGESIAYSLLALLFGGLLAEIIVTPINQVFDLELSINILSNPLLLLSFLIVGLLAGVIAGSYPAFYISRYKPSQIMRSASSKSRASTLRKVLVVFQFTLSIALIIISLVIFDQVDFLKNKKLGATVDQDIVFSSTTGIAEKIDLFKTELERHASINSVTTASRRIGNEINSGSFYEIEHKGEKVSARLSNIFVGYNFLQHYDVQLLTGRYFDEAVRSDTSTVILNESALAVLGISDAEEVLGKRVDSWFSATVIGVVKDFHFETLKNKIKPMIFAVDPTSLSWLSVKVEGENINESINHIKLLWEDLEPNREFRFSFLDQEIEQLYRSEERFFSVFTLFVAMALFIACFGLLGVVSYTVSQRLKEIGIRKVLGASANDISLLMSKDFLKLVLLANLIAYPLAYYGANVWLRDFEYRTEVQWSLFIMATAITLLLAGGTVGFSTIKAALTNPTDILKED